MFLRAKAKEARNRAWASCRVPDQIGSRGAFGAMERFVLRLGLLMLILVMAGCASVISKEVRREAAPDISFREVLRDAERYSGKLVIWSGTILEAQNVSDGTLLKILEKPADYSGKPLDVDRSSGRFLAFDKRYLDPAIYSEGRAVTVAGEIIGKRVMPLGDIEYSYPLLAVRELHLWPKERMNYYYDYPYYHYYYGYPRWWWYGW